MNPAQAYQRRGRRVAAEQKTSELLDELNKMQQERGQAEEALQVALAGLRPAQEKFLTIEKQLEAKKNLLATKSSELERVEATINSILSKKASLEQEITMLRGEHTALVSNTTDAGKLFDGVVEKNKILQSDLEVASNDLNNLQRAKGYHQRHIAEQEKQYAEIQQQALDASAAIKLEREAFDEEKMRLEDFKKILNMYAERLNALFTEQGLVGTIEPI